MPNADPGAESHSYSDQHSDPDLCSDSYAYTDSHALADYYTHANADPDTDIPRPRRFRDDPNSTWT